MVSASMDYRQPTSYVAPGPAPGSSPRKSAANLYQVSPSATTRQISPSSSVRQLSPTAPTRRSSAYGSLHLQHSLTAGNLQMLGGSVQPSIAQTLHPGPSRWVRRTPVPLQAPAAVVTAPDVEAVGYGQLPARRVASTQSPPQSIVAPTGIYVPAVGSQRPHLSMSSSASVPVPRPESITVVGAAVPASASVTQQAQPQVKRLESLASAQISSPPRAAVVIQGTVISPSKATLSTVASMPNLGGSPKPLRSARADAPSAAVRRLAADPLPPSNVVAPWPASTAIMSSRAYSRDELERRVEDIERRLRIAEVTDAQKAIQTQMGSAREHGVNHKVVEKVARQISSQLKVLQSKCEDEDIARDIASVTGRVAVLTDLLCDGEAGHDMDASAATVALSGDGYAEQEYALVESITAQSPPPVRQLVAAEIAASTASTQWQNSPTPKIWMSMPPAPQTPLRTSARVIGIEELSVNGRVHQPEPSPPRHGVFENYPMTPVADSTWRNQFDRTPVERRGARHE